MSDRKNYPPDHFPRLRRNARLTFAGLAILFLVVWIVVSILVR